MWGEICKRLESDINIGSGSTEMCLNLKVIDIWLSALENLANSFPPCTAVLSNWNPRVPEFVSSSSLDGVSALEGVIRTLLGACCSLALRLSTLSSVASSRPASPSLIRDGLQS